MKSAYASARGQGRATWLGVLHCVLLTCCAVFMHREKLRTCALWLSPVLRDRRPDPVVRFERQSFDVRHVWDKR